MNKHLIRLVALFLVPCLVVDPVTSSAFSKPSPRPTIPVEQVVFQQEAFVAYLLNFVRPIFRRDKVEEIKETPREQYLRHLEVGELPDSLKIAVHTRPWPLDMRDPHNRIVNFQGVPHMMAPAWLRERIHNGVDVKTQSGALVRAIEDGEVIYVPRDSHERQVGIFVYSPSSHLIWIYGHLSKSSLSPVLQRSEPWPPPTGVRVRAGDPIGTVGPSPLTLPHLHIEARYFPDKNDGPVMNIDDDLRKTQILNPLLLLQRLYEPAALPPAAAPKSGEYGPSTVGAAQLPHRDAILLVDDEEAILKKHIVTLEASGFNEHYDLLTAHSLPEARDVLKGNPNIVLLITDLNLTMGGRQEGLVLRQEFNEDYPGRPVLFVTGEPDELAGQPNEILDKTDTDRFVPAVKKLLPSAAPKKPEQGMGLWGLTGMVAVAAFLVFAVPYFILHPHALPHVWPAFVGIPVLFAGFERDDRESSAAPAHMTKALPEGARDQVRWVLNLEERLSSLVNPGSDHRVILPWRPDNLLLHVSMILKILNTELQKLQVDIQSSMAAVIARERARQKWTYAQMSEQTGVNATAIWKLETAQVLTSRDTQSQIASHLNLRMEDLAPQRPDDPALDQEQNLKQILWKGQQLAGFVLSIALDAFGIDQSILRRRTGHSAAHLSQATRGRKVMGLEAIAKVAEELVALAGKRLPAPLLRSIDDQRRIRLRHQIDVIIGAELQHRREELKLSKSTVQNRMGASRATLTSMEKGAVGGYSDQFLTRVAQELGTSVQEIRARAQDKFMELHALEQKIIERERTARQLISTLRKKMKLYEEDVERVIGVSDAWIYQAQHRKDEPIIVPLAGRLKAVADALRVTPDKLWPPEDLVEIEFAYQAPWSFLTYRDAVVHLKDIFHWMSLKLNSIKQSSSEQNGLELRELIKKILETQTNLKFKHKALYADWLSYVITGSSKSGDEKVIDFGGTINAGHSILQELSEKRPFMSDEELLAIFPSGGNVYMGLLLRIREALRNLQSTKGDEPKSDAATYDFFTQLADPRLQASPQPNQSPVERLAVTDLTAERLQEAVTLVRAKLGTEPRGFVELHCRNAAELEQLNIALANRGLVNVFKQLGDDPTISVILLVNTNDLRSEGYSRLHKTLVNLPIQVLPISGLIDFQLPATETNKSPAAAPGQEQAPKPTPKSIAEAA